MKINTVSQKTIASEGLVMTRMGIDESSMDMIIGYLRDKIYSDKILAPIREYISNALDAMVESCNTTDKVSVKLQSIDGSWVWSVRDYGFGLNDKDITNIFGCYGASRKRETNDQIGSYGIGAGSGFAYSDTFYVASHHKGTKTSYACTLGRGQQGVSVGEIYKISEEPTTECGIEVSIDVKSGDVYHFSSKTENFVQFYTPNSKLDFVNEYDDRNATPISPITTKKVGDYTFNTYDVAPSSYFGGNKYLIRMGGVIYPHSHVTTINGLIYNKHIIIDVPIGKLSIPISRESIESTPLNDKVFQDIDDCLLKIREEEVSVLTTPKFGSVISGNEEFSKMYKGDWFTYSYDSLFPKTRKWYYQAGKIFNEPEVCNRKVSEGPKYTVFLMPNIKSIKNWHKRLIKALTTIKGANYNGYVFMTKANYETMLSEVDKSIDLSDCAFIDVKTLKLPKLDTVPVDKTTYQVYTDYGRKEYHTAESLDKEVRENSFKGEELEDDWYLDCKNIQLIHRRTVGLVKTYGTRSGFITANSIKMVDALKELGWLTPDSVEYQDMRKAFNERDNIERTIESARLNLTTIYYGGKVSDKIKNIIAKKPDKIERFKKVKSAILREDSTRARILKSFSSYDRCITREDLRKILMLKA